MAKYRLSAAELRNKDVPELLKLLEEQRAELVALRHRALAGSIDSPAKIRETRKNVARILTVLREKRAPKGQGGAGAKAS